MCFEQEVEVGTARGTECAFLTNAFREVEKDEVVEGEEDDKGAFCGRGPAADVDAVLVLG